VDWHILPYVIYLGIYVVHGDHGDPGALGDPIFPDDRDYVLDLDVHDYLDGLDRHAVLDCQPFHLDDLYHFDARCDRDNLYHPDDLYRLDCHDIRNFLVGNLLVFDGVHASFGSHHFGYIFPVLSCVDLSSCSLPCWDQKVCHR
jgi:hypothetical protein